MPTEEMQKELQALGVKSSGTRACPKCKQMVEIWGNAKFNLADHPTSPFLLHDFSCQEPDAPPVCVLPPVPSQERGE